MPYLLDSAPRRQNNVILRPHHFPAVVLVQLDDLKQEQLERIRPAAFLTLQTSPGNHQAWVAVENGDRGFASRLKRGTEADLEASGSVRVAGTFNYKRKCGSKRTWKTRTRTLLSSTPEPRSPSRTFGS